MNQENDTKYPLMTTSPIKNKQPGDLNETTLRVRLSVLVLLLLLLENIRLAVLQLLSHLLRSRHIDLRRSRQALQHLHILYIIPRES